VPWPRPPAPAPSAAAPSDVEFEDGHRYYTKEAHVADLADEAVGTLVAFWQDMPIKGEVEIIGLGGAIGDVADAGTAFSNRGYLLSGNRTRSRCLTWTFR
jgi:hypothetical protein